MLSIGSPTREPGGSIAPNVEFFEDFVDFTFGNIAGNDGTFNAGDSLAGDISQTAGRGRWLQHTNSANENPSDFLTHAPSATGGALRITPDDNALQLNLEVCDTGTSGDGAFIMAPNKRLIFESRFRVGATTGAWLLGLAPANTVSDGATNLYTQIATSNTIPHCVLCCTASSAVQVSCQSGDVSADARITTALTYAADTWTTVQFEWDGSSRVKFYVDGDVAYIQALAPTTTTAPLGVALTPHIAWRPVSSTATMDIDYVACTFER